MVRRKIGEALPPESSPFPVPDDVTEMPEMNYGLDPSILAFDPGSLVYNPSGLGFIELIAGAAGALAPIVGGLIPNKAQMATAKAMEKQAKATKSTAKAQVKSTRLMSAAEIEKEKTRGRWVVPSVLGGAAILMGGVALVFWLKSRRKT